MGLKIADALLGWELRLSANQRSPKTISNYLESARHFADWLEASGRSTEVASIRRPVIEAYQADQAQTLTRRGQLTSGSTIASRHRCLKQLFAYLVEDEELTASPMAKMPLPKMVEPIVEVVTDRQQRQLLAVVAGSSFVDRRDAALLRFLIDTGARRAETAGMAVDDVDLRAGTAWVLGKGAKPRLVVFSSETAAAIERYLRARRAHRWAASSALWLGERGPLAVDGLAGMVERRAAQAGIGHVHPHQFRHTWAANMKAAGMQPDEFKALGGWSTDLMPERYGRATVVQRALASGRRIADAQHR